MKFIGITGGVGAGKTAVLQYLAGKEYVRVLQADQIAQKLMKPGTDCYRQIAEQFQGETSFLQDGSIDREKLANILFADEKKRTQMNHIVHPAVKRFMIETAEKERKAGELKILVLEAALLIEEHYDEICDELWYIYTREDIREKRLMVSRGYSRERVHHIFDSQLKEEDYRRYCRVVIDNNGEAEASFRQIEEALKNIVK